MAGTEPAELMRRGGTFSVRVPNPAVWLVGKAAELLVEHVAGKAALAALSKKRRTIKLEDLASVVRCVGRRHLRHTSRVMQQMACRRQQPPPQDQRMGSGSGTLLCSGDPLCCGHPPPQPAAAPAGLLLRYPRHDSRLVEAGLRMVLEDCAQREAEQREHRVQLAEAANNESAAQAAQPGAGGGKGGKLQGAATDAKAQKITAFFCKQ